MKTWKSYKQERPEAQQEAIVIGSGIGGLTTARLLADEGIKPLILEQHYTPGGFTHTFKRKDYEWDVGVHYIGEVNREGTALRRLFDYLSGGKLKWQDMGEVYDRIVFGDEAYEFVKGVENFKARMKEYFPQPEDMEAIDRYIDVVRDCAHAARKFFTEKALPQGLALFAAPFMKSRFMRYASKTTLEVLRDITSNGKLIGVLTGQYGDYGLPPGQSSFGMHAMVVKHYLNGAAYPVGGSGRIAQTVYREIEKHGGQLYTNARVKQILVEDGQAMGVIMDDDYVIRAPLVISNAGAINTFGYLLPEEEAEKHGFDRKLKQLKGSYSHICLYVGLKGTKEELGLGTANFWLYPSEYDHDYNVKRFLQNPDKAPLPVAYISFPSAKDPEWELRYPGRSTIEVITLAPYEWFEQWTDTRWHHRGEDYEAFKERLSQRLLEALYRVEPQLKGKIDYYELSTPLSTRHFAAYPRGEIYGLEHSPERFRLSWLRARTPVKNLFLTGQDLATAGVGGALFGGVICASSILKKDVLSGILRQTTSSTNS